MVVQTENIQKIIAFGNTKEFGMQEVVVFVSMQR
jgi:hypothetical protein